MSEPTKKPEFSPELHEQLGKLGVSLLTIPAPTGDDKIRLDGWRNGIEKYGQELLYDPHVFIWSEPLTDNERASIAGVLERERGSDAANWLAHVLKCYDARFGVS